MTPHDFVRKWKPVTLTEMSAYQQHFLDLCELLGEKKPADVDPTGEWFTFQKGVTKANDKKGWADVWRRGCFGWEYKGKWKDLKAAYEQLLQYREALLNPPLLIVCDLDRFEIHTNFPNTVKKVHTFDLDSLVDPKNIDLLRKAFTAPEDLKPGTTQEQVTQAIASQFAKLADGLRKRGIAPDRAAHFLVRLVFCMFAEDIGLLPRDTFTGTVRKAGKKPAALSAMLRDLFAKMATGGYFGTTHIAHFNGGLFKDAEIFDLTSSEISDLLGCAEHDWSHIEPSIFGTLFERSLDPAKRARLGAFYTSKTDIETLLRPVFENPLLNEWDDARDKMQVLWKQVQAAVKKAGGKKTAATRKARAAFDSAVMAFANRLWSVVVLDPACGSGNFLYTALKILLDIEKDVWEYATARDVNWLPQVSPTQLRGLEINAYARELAQVVVWIGYLQWVKFNGFGFEREPILGSMEEIREQDAILNISDPNQPKEPDWPEAEFIVGNPPFLGDKKMRAELGDEYVDALRKLYAGRLPAQSDLCCYWFEKARCEIEVDHAKRVGLLATQGIRGGANREVLERIKQTGDIFFAVSDRDWVLEGANVHVSMVGFDDGTEQCKMLDGHPVSVIHPSLTATTNVAIARRLSANGGVSFIGAAVHGPFDVNETVAVDWLSSPNPHGRPNSDVVRTWANSMTITQRPGDTWMVDCPPNLTSEDAAFYEKPFEFLTKTVRPVRELNRRPMRKKNWWILGDPQKAMRAALRDRPRFLITPRVSKHRLFVWVSLPLLPTDATVAFASSDDYFFGVLHSRVHEIWSLRTGTRLEDRPRYTPTTCFETFPFPEPFAALQGEIGDAAKELDKLRNRWLNPPDWTKMDVLEFPGSVDGPWNRYIETEDIGDGVGTVRFPRTVPKNAECATKLKARTLTNLYNERPAWLEAAHKKLDELVFAAYGWSPSLTDSELLTKLLELNLSRPTTGTPVEVEEDTEPATVAE